MKEPVHSGHATSCMIGDHCWTGVGDGVLVCNPMPGDFERRHNREHRNHVEGIAIPHAGTRALTAVAAGHW